MLLLHYILSYLLLTGSSVATVLPAYKPSLSTHQCIVVSPPLPLAVRSSRKSAAGTRRTLLLLVFSHSFLLLSSSLPPSTVCDRTGLRHGESLGTWFAPYHSDSAPYNTDSDEKCIFELKEA
ncbi:hypothetical protein EDB89DRAFT_1298090 [Lactarius sanguifluus]|nr:hypothetical protein EDB89DRAFT_1298090 [Lactarius sanguifluus]